MRIITCDDDLLIIEKLQKYLFLFPVVNPYLRIRAPRI